MLIKVKCEHCQSEFEDEGLERTAFCPSCGKETHILPFRSGMSASATGLLTRCPSCQSAVSTEAAACPTCGHQFKYAGGINLKDPVHVIGLIVTALIAIGVVWYIHSVTVIYN